MISFRPIFSRIAARVLGRSLADSARRTVDIAPATRWEVDLPVMLPGEAERIRAHHADSTPSTNIALLTERVIEQGPTRMHLLCDAIVADGTVLTRTSYDRIKDGGRRMMLRGRPQHVPEGALCSTQVTERYFGHWLKDGVAHELLASDHDLKPLVLAREPWKHEPGYRKLLDLYAAPIDYAVCDRLWLLEDWEANRNFVSRYDRLRDRVRSSVGTADGAERVFLARGSMGTGRALTNEAEVRSALEQRGFKILDPTHASADEIARTLASAQILVSPEGSALSHAIIAMPRGSGVLTIVGAQHFNLAYKGICDALGIRFGLTIADADGDGFSQPVDRLLRTIDLLERSLA